MGNSILPQGLDGKDWQILQSANQEVSVNLRQHIATAVPAVTQGLEQAHYHELARIMFSAGHEPDITTHAGILAEAIEELRLDLLLEERGIPQDKRLEDHDWAQAPRFDASTAARDRLRFLLETVWQAQEEGPLTQHWLNTFNELQRDKPSLIDALKGTLPQLQQAVKQGGDGLAERDELARQLWKLLDPPPPPPKPVTPQQLSHETQQKIQEAAKPKPEPAEAPKKKQTRLRKIEKPKPEPQEEDEEAATSESTDEESANNDSSTASSKNEERDTQEEGEDGNGDADQSEKDSGARDDAEEEDGAEEKEESGGKSDAGEDPEADEEELDGEDDGDGESGAEASEEELEDDGDREDEEGGEEEKDYAAEYEEVEETDEERREREEQEAEDRAIADALNQGGESVLQVYDPKKPHGVGGDAKVGHMLIHDHVKTSKRTHMVRKTAGARDRGVIPTQFHRYAMDKAVFSAKRPGGTILIDGSGSMNWDPDKLEVLISQLPTATIAIYHGSEVDWEVTTGLGATLQAAAKQQQDAWTAWREYQNDQNDYDYDKERQLGRERQAAFESWKRVATAAGYQPVDSPWVAGIQRAGAAVNGTLCILGKQGRWGPLAHGLGGGNNVDVEALQWLAAQPGPRVWISDGRVTGGFYYGMLGSQGLEHLCEELCRRHRITRTPTVQAALKQLRVTIPSLAKLGI